MTNVVRTSVNGMEALAESFDESVSTCSDAGDILIRSTGIRFPNICFGKQNVGSIPDEPVCNDKVTLSVKRLREVTPSMDVTTETVFEREPVFVPPALAANRPLASPEGVTMASSSDKAKVQPGDRKVKDGPGGNWDSQTLTADVKKPLSRSSPPGGSDLQDVLISQHAGGKEAVRAALKQRSQSAPLRREVKVQLLNRAASATQGSQAPTLTPGDQGPGAAAVAVTAATLAATMPLLKAQSDLDSRLSRFSEDLRRLQEGGVQLGRTQEDRSSEMLQQQLHTLTQQRLQHLERIQEQQLELQNRLLGSALDVVTARVPGPVGPPPAPAGLGFDQGPRGHSVDHPGPQAPGRSEAAAGHLDQRGHRRQSPPETPAPRTFVPLPMPRDARKHSAPKGPSRQATADGIVFHVNDTRRRYMRKRLNQGAQQLLDAEKCVEKAGTVATFLICRSNRFRSNHRRLP